MLLILRWIKLLLASFGRPENDGNVVANVLEKLLLVMLIYTKPLETKTLKQEEPVVGEYIAVSIVYKLISHWCRVC